MENVVYVEMVQKFESADMYLSYIQKKYGPKYVNSIKNIIEGMDFASTFKKTFSFNIVGGEVLRNAGCASIFNLIEVASRYSLKVVDPIVSCLMFVNVLDNAHLRNKFSSLYFISNSYTKEAKGFFAPLFYNVPVVPYVKKFNYANLTFNNFQKEVGFVFGIKDKELIPVGIDRV